LSPAFLCRHPQKLQPRCDKLNLIANHHHWKFPFTTARAFAAEHCCRQTRLRIGDSERQRRSADLQRSAATSAPKVFRSAVNVPLIVKSLPNPTSATFPVSENAY